MAYKFQIGSAKLSGSVTSTGVIDAEGALSGALIQVDDASGIAGNGLDNSSGKLTIDLDGSTGITVDADGMSLASIPNSSLANSTISGKALGANLDALSAGNGISMTAYNGSAAVSNLTIARSGSDASGLKLNSDGLAILVSGSTGLNLTNDGIRLNAVPNASLANSGVTLSQGAGMAAMGAVSLGGSVTVGVDGVLEDLDTLGAAASDGQFIVATGAGAFAYESGATVRTSLGLAIGTNVQAFDAQLADIAGLSPTDGNIIIGDGSNFVLESGATARTSLGLGTGNDVQFTDLTLTGDLTVQGTTTTIDTDNLTVKDANIVLRQGGAGNADDIGFTFGSTSNTQTLQTKDSSGTQKLASSLPLSASTYYGDGSNLSGVQANNARLTVSDLADVAVVSGGLSAGFHFAGNLSQDQVVHLSSSAGGWNDGEVVYIKLNDANNTLTVTPSGTNHIEGVNGQSIVLETQGAAVTLVRKGTGFFIV